MLYENHYDDGRLTFAAEIMGGGRPFMTHCHKEMEIISVLRGQVVIKNDDQVYTLREGDVWMAAPFTSHSIESATPESQRLAMLLDLKIMGAWMQREGEERDVHKLLEETDMYSGHWPEATTQQVRQCIQEMYGEYKAQESGWNLAVKIGVNRLVLMAMREMPRRSAVVSNRSMEKLKDILEYVALHYCSDISLEACAAQVGFNASYLSRYFKAHMGVTFQEYVKQLRIDRARWLLRNERLPVTEVGYLSGFKDIKTFNKLFKNECQMTPTQYRRVNES